MIDDNGEVDLSDRQLSQVPDELRGRTDVRSLLLQRNRLDELPAWIGTLRNLENLDLAGNPLRQLPGELAELSQLRSVDIYSCSFAAFPESVCRLPNLTFLGASRNGLASVPRLPSTLKHLYLGHNDLAAVPESVRELTSLESLFLSGNSIRTIPTWINELKSLHVLRLSLNRLERLPPEVAELLRLEELYVGQNLIAELPTAFSRLRRLTTLELDREKLIAPQALTYGYGTSSLLAYLRGLERGAATPREAKLMVVGEGGTGKTTLVRRLETQRFNPKPSTHGVEITRIPVEASAQTEKPYTINAWDFGGQEVYRVTHQFFFSRSALYLLVWKPRFGAEEGAVEGWLRRIRLRIGPNARVVIVATHGDERFPEIDVPGLKETFGPMIADVVTVDSLSGNGFDELLSAVEAELDDLPYFSMEWPSSWIDVRDRLADLAVTHPQLSWGDYTELCNAHGLSADEHRSLAEVLNELGNVVFWGDDPSLRDILVLQPEWLTKAISFILEDRQTRESGGVLDYERAIEVWDAKRLDAGFSGSHYPYFLRLMERFDVSYRIEHQPRALVGQMVPYGRPVAVSEKALASGARSMTATIELSEEPPGLVPWLIVRTNRDWSDPPVHWRRGVVLSRKKFESDAILELSQDGRRLSIKVSAPSPDFYFHVMLDTFEEVAHRWPGLSWQILMPCPARHDHGQECQEHISLNVLMRARESRLPAVMCHGCFQPADVGEMLTGFRQASSESSRSEELVTITRQLDALQEQMAMFSAQSIGQLTEVADAVRGMFRYVSTEVRDCPRLVSLEPTEQRLFDVRRFFNERFWLHLWCEHEDDRHRVGRYGISRPREWWIEASPYIRAVSFVLQGVPALRSLIDVSLAGEDEAGRADDLRRLKAELDLMSKVGDIALIAPEHASTHATQSPDYLLRAGSRQVRAAILDLDGSRQFHGLARTPVTSTGEFFWVCPDHMPHYDPGLPSFPNDAVELAL